MEEGTGYNKFGSVHPLCIEQRFPKLPYPNYTTIFTFCQVLFFCFLLMLTFVSANLIVKVVSIEAICQIRRVDNSCKICFNIAYTALSLMASTYPYPWLYWIVLKGLWLSPFCTVRSSYPLCLVSLYQQVINCPVSLFYFSQLDYGKLEVLRLWVNLLAVRWRDYRKHKQRSSTPLSILTVTISARLPQ